MKKHIVYKKEIDCYLEDGIIRPFGGSFEVVDTKGNPQNLTQLPDFRDLYMLWYGESLKPLRTKKTCCDCGLNTASG